MVIPLAALRLAYGDSLGGMLDTKLREQIAARKTEVELLETLLAEKLKQQVLTSRR